MDESESKAQTTTSGQRKRVKRVRREMTWSRKLERRFENLFGGRSVGNVAAAVLLATSIFVGIWATIQSVL